MRKNRKSPLISEKDLLPENVRIRISMMVPEDLLLAYKKEAKKMGIGYQTLMQMRLRESLESGPKQSEIESRLARIEKAIFKNKVG